MTRDERQIQSLNAWAIQSYQGCLQAVTGFGKTRVAIIALRSLKKKDLISSATVTVPTIVLKEQWEKELQSFDIDFVKVVVNNTAALYPEKYKCDLLICDEVHTVPTDTRNVILDIPHKYFLGLSATIKRQDGRHEEIIERYPVFDVVGFEECLSNGWISPYKIYNVGVDMPEDLMAEYQKANRQFKHVAAQISLYGVDTMRTAQQWASTGNDTEKAMSARYYANMNKRKTLCINNPNKVNIVEKIVSLCPDRYGIVFSQSVEFADSITSAIGDLAVTFHSKMTKKTQKEILDNFKDLNSDTRIISSVQALDAGFDFVELSLAIVAAGYSSQLTNIQRIGRTVRAKEGKDAIIINLYSKGTQEETWLEKRQKGTKNVQYIQTSHLMEILNETSNQLHTP